MKEDGSCHALGCWPLAHGWVRWFGPFLNMFPCGAVGLSCGSGGSLMDLDPAGPGWGTQGHGRWFIAGNCIFKKLHFACLVLIFYFLSSFSNKQEKTN